MSDSRQHFTHYELCNSEYSHHSQPYSHQNCQLQPQLSQFNHLQLHPSQSHQLTRQEMHSKQPPSPERHLAALPDSFVGSSTPQCSCHVQQHQYQLSPCTPSSSLLSFSDSSASHLSEQSQGADADAASPQAAQNVFDDRRRLRLMQHEENRMQQFLTDLDSRLRLANAPTMLDGPSKNMELLALQQMSAQNLLRTVQLYVAEKSEQVAASASKDSVHQQASRAKCGSMLWNESDSSGSDDCSLLDN